MRLKICWRRSSGPINSAGVGALLFTSLLCSAAGPRVQVRDFAGQWAVAYGNGTVGHYTFSKDGKISGDNHDQKVTGHIELRDDAFVLTFNENDAMVRLAPRPDGRVDAQFFDHGSDFPNKPSQPGVGTPASGETHPGIEALDARMLNCLEQMGCSGATLTVTRGNKTLFSRGYGWSDEKHKVPISPNTPMSIASCDKPLTGAMIRQLAADGKLDLNASVLKVLDIKPAGPVVDNRVWNITISHLLDHKAGWQGAPVDKAWQKANGHVYPIDAVTLVSYVAAEKLSWTPGTKAEYDSFAYNTLKRVVAKVSGQSYVDYLRSQLCRRYGVNELKWVRRGAQRPGEPPQLWNGLIMEDPEEYRMGVSMPALCTFMRHFWIDGSPRDNGNPLWIMGGGWSNSTTEMIWRSDGINIAWSFNGGKDGVDPGEDLWHKAIDWELEEQHIPKR